MPGGGRFATRFTERHPGHIVNMAREGIGGRKKGKGDEGEKLKIQARTKPGIKANTCPTNHENTFPDTMAPIWGPRKIRLKAKTTTMFQSSTKTI